MKMHFIGDVHGKEKELKNILAKIPYHENVIQVGDLGLGFTEFDYFPKNFFYIRGNHDNPRIAQKDIFHYMGDYGLFGAGIFYISGANSVDKYLRVEGRDWWRNEELSIEDLELAITAYIMYKPAIMISHDCPRSIAKIATGNNISMTRTNMALETMLSEHKPNIWIFGHHHISFDAVINNTRFICLNELELKTLEF